MEGGSVFLYKMLITMVIIDEETRFLKDKFGRCQLSLKSRQILWIGTCQLAWRLRKLGLWPLSEGSREVRVCRGGRKDLWLISDRFRNDIAQITFRINY